MTVDLSLHPGRGPAEEVLVYAATQRRSTWHARTDCPRLGWVPPAVSRVLVAADLGQPTWSTFASAPCVTCAEPLALDLAVSWAGAAGRTGTRLVLACPKTRFAQDDSHGRCPRCRRLRAFADRHALACHRTRDGYTLVAATLAAELTWVARHAFAVHPVPADCPDLDRDALAVAWAARTDASGGLLPALYVPHTGTYQPLAHLGMTAAALVTAPPAP